jgi:hypothetical protein
MDAEQTLAQAQALLQTGQPEPARRLLMALVTQHPAHEEGWLLLSTVVEADRAVDCLKRVLALNPGHARARKWLALAVREQERQAALRPPPPAQAAADDVPLYEPGDEQRPVPRLGQYLLDFKFVRPEQLRSALVAQRRARDSGQARRVGELLLEQGALSEERLNFAVREQSRGFFSQFQD